MLKDHRMSRGGDSSELPLCGLEIYPAKLAFISETATIYCYYLPLRIVSGSAVSGNELQEIRTAIAGLQKGELIIKDQMAFALGMGRKYKRINVTHLI